MRPVTSEKSWRNRLYWAAIRSWGGALTGVLARNGQFELFTPLTAVADETADETDPTQRRRCASSFDRNECLDLDAAEALGMDRELARRIHVASRTAPENNESSTDEIRRLPCALLHNTEALTYENVEELQAAYKRSLK